MVAQRQHRVRARLRRASRYFHASLLHRAHRRHGYVAALRIAGDEEAAAVADTCVQVAGNRLAGSDQGIDHVLGLLIGIQVGVVRQGRNVVAGVVRCHDDIALGGVKRRHHGGFLPAVVAHVVDGGHVEGFGNRRAVGVEQDGARAGATRSARRRHDHARRVRQLALAADGFVLVGIEGDTAFRRTGHRQRGLSDRVHIELGRECVRIHRRHLFCGQ